MKLADIHITLTYVRRERNLSQQDAAEALNVEQATISLYENKKRSIPLDFLDNWLQALDVDVKITPRDYLPQKTEEETTTQLELFNNLKKRRNFLVAELRSIMAQRVVQDSKFCMIKDETGENQFWPYSYSESSDVGLVETRYDHPLQKFLAVEYTADEVNVYRFIKEASDEKLELSINRLYLSEDDFLTLCDSIEENSGIQKVTILRKNNRLHENIEIIETAGFTIHALLELQENHIRLKNLINERTAEWDYVRMKNELSDIQNQLAEIVMDNKLCNGNANPDFQIWTDTDRDTVAVPLWSTERIWHWTTEGVEWHEIETESE